MLDNWKPGGESLISLKEGARRTVHGEGVKMACLSIKNIREREREKMFDKIQSTRTGNFCRKKRGERKMRRMRERSLNGPCCGETLDREKSGGMRIVWGDGGEKQSISGDLVKL